MKRWLNKNDRIRLEAYEILKTFLCGEEGELIGTYALCVIDKARTDRAVVFVAFPHGIVENHGGPVRNMPDNFVYNKPNVYKSSGAICDERSMDEKILDVLIKAKENRGNMV